MKNFTWQLITGAVLTVVVGVLSGGRWPYFVVGAVLALSLWVMLFAGSYGGGPAKGEVDARSYAGAAVLSVVLGYPMSLIGDGPVWWAVGVIMAGAIVPAVPALRGGGDSESPGSGR